MDDDIRCCGTGTCLISAEGFCWCGQQWDGANMCFAAQPAAAQSPARLIPLGDQQSSDTPSRHRDSLSAQPARR